MDNQQELREKFKSLYDSGKYEQAIKVSKEIEELTLNEQGKVGVCYQCLGFLDEALDIFIKLAAEEDIFGCLSAEIIYDKLGNTQEALKYKNIRKKINKKRQQYEFLYTIDLIKGIKHQEVVSYEGYERDGVFHITDIFSQNQIVYVDCEKPAIIEEDAFALQSIFFAAINIEQLDSSCFMGSTVMGIALGPKVKNIHNNILVQTPNYFYVVDDNPYYYADETGLYTKDQKRLICATIVGDVYLVRNTVTEISPYAFIGSDTLKKVIIKKGQCDVSHIQGKIAFVEEDLNA